MFNTISCQNEFIATVLSNLNRALNKGKKKKVLKLQIKNYIGCHLAPVTVEAPQDRHRQDHRTGTSRAEQITEAMAKLGALEAMAELGALKAMAGGLSWPWPRPCPRRVSKDETDKID